MEADMNQCAKIPSRRALLGFPTLFALAALGLPLTGQQTTGTILGTVTDTSAAVVPGVRLELTNVETNSAFRQTSGTAGTYIFNAVPPGSYQLTAQLEGFKMSKATAIQVEINRNTVIDIVIEPGQLTQTVDVRAGIETIDTQSAAVKTNVSSQLIVELPSTSRNVLQMAQMAPGVEVSLGSLTGGSQMLSSGGIAANVGGGRQQQNTFYLDGSDNSGPIQNLGLQMPNPEAVAEVQVVSSSNAAESGKQPGGYFNVFTKSGTNELHGSGFYFGRDNRLNANEWSRNKNGLPKLPANQKQFGGTLGGPILRNRTFFFGSYQHYRDEATSTYSTTKYPTKAMLAGDFSEFKGVLTHPDTKLPIPNNNIAAAGLLNPVAVKLAQATIPTVSNLGDRLIWQFTTPPRSNEYLGKIDHNLTSVQRLQYSLFMVRGSTLSGGGGVPNYNMSARTSKQVTMAARHTWTANASTIIESQFSLARHEVITRPDPPETRDLSDFGAKWPPLTTKGYVKSLPQITIYDGFTSNSGGGGLTKQENFRVNGSATLIRGKHNFKAGVETQRSDIRSYDYYGGTTFRYMGYVSNAGKAPTNYAPNGQFAHCMADFMMGQLWEFEDRGAFDYEMPSWSFSGYVQDQWRITRKFTLNPGLRYELYTPASEVDGRASAFVAGHKSDQFANAPLHLAFQGDKGIEKGFIPLVRNNFGPRIGFAYDVFGNNKLAIRGGYGRYFAYPAAQVKIWAAAEFPQRPSASGNQANLSDPWGTSKMPVYQKPPTPWPAEHAEYLREHAFIPPFDRVIGFSRDWKTPSSHQYNISVERQLANGFTVTGGYVGNRGVNLLQGFPFNYAKYINLPDGSPPSLEMSNIVARTPFPTMSRYAVMIETKSKIWYDSLQLSGNLRRGGLTTRLSYVLARDRGHGGSSGQSGSEDPSSFTTQINNPSNAEDEIGPRSRRNTFRVFSIYELPFLRNNKGLLGRLLGGWQASGYLQILSGDPMDVILGYDANFDAITNTPRDRPDLAKPIRYTGGSAERQMQQYFDPASFAKPVITARSLFGNLPYNAIWGPGRWSSDMALLKNFRLSERMRFQIRAEAYNFSNHPNLGSPGTTMSGSDFTKILTLSGNRTMQFGLKFSF
jgi:hypothetical protein